MFLAILMAQRVSRVNVMLFDPENVTYAT